jgi:Cof subfamily protein (haloacid dehalogenase superfamily)
VQVVLTTGRPLEAIRYLLDDLGLTGPDHYSITFNGGLVQRNDGAVLAQTLMSRAEVAVVHAVVSQFGLTMDVISQGTVYSFPVDDQFSAYREVNPNLTFVDVTSPDELPADETYNKVVIVADQAYLDELIAKLPVDLYDQFEVFKSREIILEIMPKGVHKAAGLAQLIAHLSIEPSQVLTMGDEENDLSMLAWAGWGIAVGNAVPAAKQAARLTLDRTNNQSAVAAAINRYVLKKGDDHGLI